MLWVFISVLACPTGILTSPTVPLWAKVVVGIGAGLLALFIFTAVVACLLYSIKDMAGAFKKGFKRKMEVVERSGIGGPCCSYEEDPHICYDFGEPKGQCLCGWKWYEHELPSIPNKSDRESACRIKAQDKQDGIIELETMLVNAGICPVCGKEFVHDISEPFASCDCGTCEWTGKLPLISDLRHQLYQANETATIDRPAS